MDRRTFMELTLSERAEAIRNEVFIDPTLRLMTGEVGAHLLGVQTVDLPNNVQSRVNDSLTKFGRKYGIVNISTTHRKLWAVVNAEESHEEDDQAIIAELRAINTTLRRLVDAWVGGVAE